jgi:hypothetical protein
MTPNWVTEQIEAIERLGREACKSPESARALLDKIAKVRGGVYKDKKVPKPKKKNNA